MVNVGVVMICTQPWFIEGMFEKTIPQRVSGLFPDQDGDLYASSIREIAEEVDRIARLAQKPHACRLAFNELVRPRENTFRFGEVRTVLTEVPHELCEQVFRRYVRMEKGRQPVVVEGKTSTG